MVVSAMFFSEWRVSVGLGIGLLTVCVACQTPPTTNRFPAVSLSKPAITIESLRQPQQVERLLPLAGAVTQRLAILNGWLYQIDDGTGQVWILSQKSAPAVGTHIYVHGFVRYEAIIINEADLGDYYLEETQRRLKPSEHP